MEATWVATVGCLGETIADLEAAVGMLRQMRHIDPRRLAEVDDDVQRLGDMAAELRGDALDVLEALAALSVPRLSLVVGERR